MPPPRAESEEERRASLATAAAPAGAVPVPSSVPLALVRTLRPGHHVLKGEEAGEVPLGDEALQGAAGGEVPGEAPDLAPPAVLPLCGAGPSTLPLAVGCSAAAAVPFVVLRTGLSMGSGGRLALASLLPMVMGCVVLPPSEDPWGLLSAASAASAASLAGPLAEPRLPGDRPCGAARDQLAVGGLVPRGDAETGEAPAGALPASPTACCACCACARAEPPLPPALPSRLTRLWCSWEGDSRLRWPGVGVAARELSRLASGEPPNGEPPRGLPPSGEVPARERAPGRQT